MKNELRGKKFKNIRLDKMEDIKRVYEEFIRNEANDEDVLELKKEYGCDIRLFDNEKELSDAIRKRILELYNEDISATIMFLYIFIKWYKKAVKSLEKQGQYENRLELLDFGTVLNMEVIRNIKEYLTLEYNKDCVDEHIMALQYKLIAQLKTKLILDNEAMIWRSVRMAKKYSKYRF